MTALRFECQAGRLYELLYAERLRYLTEADLARMAKFLKIRPADFERRYVHRTKTLLGLRMPRHTQCHFLREDGCSIHSAKPTQCRVFPFWPELVDDKRARKGAVIVPESAKGNWYGSETRGSLRVRCARLIQQCIPASILLTKRISR